MQYLPKLALALVTLVLTSASMNAAVWQYFTTFTTSNGKAAEARLWIPPETREVRGLIISSYISAEIAFSTDPAIRQVATEKDLGIILFNPGFGTFAYASNDDEVIMPQVIADLADISGYPEVEHCPWITFGHSTGGIFARNVAYWDASRVAGILHFKSGNYHQHIQVPGDPFPSVPMLAINGQLEEYGPEGQNPSDGTTTWEIQWLAGRTALLGFRAQGLPVSLLVEPGAGHMAYNPVLSDFLALYIEKTVDFRIPEGVIARDGPIALLPYVESDGWLTEAVPGDVPTHATAAYADYTGPRDEAFWHYDQEIADAWVAFHLGKMDYLDQIIRFNNTSSSGHDRDKIAASGAFGPDGYTFTVSASYLTTYPSTHPDGGQPLGNSGNPIQIRIMRGPAEKIGPNTFRIKPDTLGFNFSANRDIRILAYVEAGNGYRFSDRMASMKIGDDGSANYRISFPAVPDPEWDSDPIPLNATSATGETVEYYVAHGPGIIENGELVLSEMPLNGKFPVELTVRAVVWKVSSGQFSLSNERSQTISIQPPPLKVSTISMNSGQINLQWQGGLGPFIIEKSTNLDPFDWSFHSFSVHNRINFPVSSDPLEFYRVSDSSGL